MKQSTNTHTYAGLILIIALSQYPPIAQTDEYCHLPDLPDSHLQLYLNTFPAIRANACFQNLTTNTSSRLCWGHEYECSEAHRFQSPTCPENHTGWVQSKKAQSDTFYAQADFGYIREQIHDLKLMCKPKYISDSSLECTKYLRFCRGRHLLIDFRDLPKRKEYIRYNMDVLKQGQFMGHCELNRSRLKAEMDHMSALQSWSPELRNFEETPLVLSSQTENGPCDEFVDKPTFILKIDSTYNMYHHFCDFFNLYASLFVNQTHPDVFDKDIRILIWETYPYDSPFSVTFKAFTQNEVWTLNEVMGKRVCFRNVVLPLLPRMIFGLFYNTPLIEGCHESGLFRAFSEFILHRLRVPFEKPLPESKIRITFLSRRTKFRQALNEEELLAEIKSNKNYQVRLISFESGLNFTEQLKITRNTDLLIGMHGAGLTHLLFLPNWASIFELYNCEDPNCYKDLSRLRGVHYLTWQQQHLVYQQDEGTHPQGGAHAKFTNYSFDVKEFARLVQIAAKHIREHKEYQEYQSQFDQRFPDEL